MNTVTISIKEYDELRGIKDKYLKDSDDEVIKRQNNRIVDLEKLRFNLIDEIDRNKHKLSCEIYDEIDKLTNVKKIHTMFSIKPVDFVLSDYVDFIKSMSIWEFLKYRKTK